MKSLVLFLFLLEFVLNLAQVKQQRWVHWLPPNHNFQVCHHRGFGPNTWPKVAVHQMILPAPSPGNVGWRHNQGIDNWVNPFQSIFFGFPNFFSPWGFQPQYQSGMLPRYPRRQPPPMAPHFGSMHGQWPLAPHLGPTHGPWPGPMGPTHGPWPGSMGSTHGPWPGPIGPTNRHWPMYPHIGPTPGPWPMHPHMAPHIAPYYLGDRHHYFVN